MAGLACAGELRKAQMDWSTRPVEYRIAVLQRWKDRLLAHRVHITGEHLEEIQHALLAHPGATLDTIRQMHFGWKKLAEKYFVWKKKGRIFNWSALSWQ